MKTSRQKDDRLLLVVDFCWRRMDADPGESCSGGAVFSAADSCGDSCSDAHSSVNSVEAVEVRI